MTKNDFRRAIVVKKFKLGLWRKVLKVRPYSIPSSSKSSFSGDIRYDKVNYIISL